MFKYGIQNVKVLYLSNL